MTAIVAIIAIIVIVAVGYFVLQGRMPAADSGAEINVDLPTGDGQ
jgi:hypothetical protein